MRSSMCRPSWQLLPERRLQRCGAQRSGGGPGAPAGHSRVDRDGRDARAVTHYTVTSRARGARFDRAKPTSTVRGGSKRALNFLFSASTGPARQLQIPVIRLMLCRMSNADNRDDRLEILEDLAPTDAHPSSTGEINAAPETASAPAVAFDAVPERPWESVEHRQRGRRSAAALSVIPVDVRRTP